MAPSADNEGFTDRLDNGDETTTVAVVGAGPAGLMLAYVPLIDINHVYTSIYVIHKKLRNKQIKPSPVRSQS